MKCKFINSYNLSNTNRYLSFIVINPGYITSKRFKKLRIKIRHMFRDISEKHHIRRFFSKRKIPLEKFFGLNLNKIHNTLYMRHHYRMKMRYYYNFRGNYVLTKKGKNSRMGKGKGDFKHWLCRVERGDIMFKVNFLKGLRWRWTFNRKYMQKLRVKFFISFYNNRYSSTAEFGNKGYSFNLLSKYRYN